MEQLTEEDEIHDPKPTKLFNKNFFLLWQGQFVSQIGSQAFNIAMVYWIMEKTGSATLVGLIMMVAFLPAVLLGPLAGTFADRHSRRSIIIICDLLSGISVLTLAVLFFLVPQERDLILTWLFIVAIIVAILQAFFRPAIAAAIPDLVPEDKIEAANSLKEGTFQASMFLGFGVGGVLFKVLGAPFLFLADGISYLASAFSEYFIKIPQRIPVVHSQVSAFESFMRDTKKGLQYVWARPGMRNFFMAIAVLNFFAIPITTLLAFFVDQYLKLGVEWYGFLMASWGLGSIVGFAIASAAKMKGFTRSIVVMVMLVGVSLAIAAFGFVRSPWIALATLFTGGIMGGVINISILSVLQRSTPSEIRGRVFGLLATLSGGLIPVAMGLSGIVADLVDQNIPLIYTSAGIIATILSIWITTSKDFRKFLAYEKDTSEQDQMFDDESYLSS